MIAIIITLVIVLTAGAVAFLLAGRDAWSHDWNWVSGIFCALAVMFIAGLLMSIAFVPLAGVAGGLMPDYSTGTREGFITKVSVKGVFWKTNEAQIQVGTGEMAALQEPFSFSISDPDMARLIETYLGERVRIEYKQWLIQPYSLGETPYDCVSILPIND